MEQGYFLFHIIFIHIYFFPRTSTIILVRHDQTGLFIEKTLNNPLINPLEWIEHKWHFNLNNVNESPVLIN